jgi:hypothetical protein
MLSGSNPENPQDKRNHREHDPSIQQSPEWAQWSKFTAADKSNRRTQALARLDSVFDSFQSCAELYTPLRNAVSACAHISAEGSLLLADKLALLKSMSAQDQVQTCEALEAFFTKSLKSSHRASSKLFDTALAWLTSSATAAQFYRTGEFLSTHPDFLFNNRYLSVVKATEALPVPEAIKDGASARMMAQILITDSAVSDNWRFKHLEKIIDTFRSPNHTPEGYACRIYLIENKRPKEAPLFEDLQAITTLEAMINNYRLNMKQRERLFQTDETIRITRCIKSIPEGLTRDKLISLITDLNSRPISEGASKHITNKLSNYKQLNNFNITSYLDNLQEAVDLGCSIDLACCLYSRENSYFKEFNTIMDRLSNSKTEHKSNNKKLYNAVDVFAQRVSKLNGRSEFEEMKAIVRTLVEGFILSNSAQASATSLHQASSIQKLVLCMSGAGLPEEEALSSNKELIKIITELSAAEDINTILYFDSLDSEQLLTDFSMKYWTDNPPFSLFSTPPEVQEHFTEQVWSVFLRAQDGHYGFWANTYEFRHTPIGKRCPFDEMAKGLSAETYLIPCKNIDAFPGRGRHIKNIDVSSVTGVLFEDEIWQDEIFASYGPLPNVDTVGNVHALLSLARASITHTRAFDSFSIPNNSFFSFHGEPLSFMTWNHHFDATGTKQITLVPTRALNAILEKYLLPIEDSANVRLDDLDISDQPPTLAAIQRKAQEMALPVGVIHPTSPSTFTGGFSNALGGRLNAWQREDQVKDKFGHSHKWYIKERTDLLNKLWSAHQRIYEITTGYLNVRDMYKFTTGLDARGYVNRSSQPHYPNSSWQEDQYQIRYGREKLKFFCEYYSECRTLGRSELAPVLVIAPSKYMAASPDSPLVLDGQTGFAFHSWGRPFDLNISDGLPSQDLLEWWADYVDPLLDQKEYFWYAPRLVARENYLGLMEEYGYRR